MSRYDPHQSYRRCFREVDDLLWNHVAETVPGDLERYRRRVSEQAGRIKEIITAYVDKHAAMMIELIGDERFGKCPLPRPSFPDDGADQGDDSGEDGKRPLKAMTGKLILLGGFSCGLLLGFLLAKLILTG